MRITTIGIALATALFAAPAGASDLFGGPDARGDYEAPAIWTGAYIGIQGGWGEATRSGRTMWTDYDLGGGDISLDGGLGGFEAGYSHQIGAIVLGIEGDISFGNVEGTENFRFSTGYNWKIDTSIGMLATMRGRLGVALGPVLLYGTGGVAFADTSSDETVTITDTQQGLPVGMTTVKARASDNHVGFVYGAGAEWMIAKGLSFKGEWLHLDLGDSDQVFKGTAYPGTPGAFSYSDDSFPGSLEMNIFRAGLNYRF